MTPDQRTFGICLTIAAVAYQLGVIHVAMAINADAAAYLALLSAACCWIAYAAQLYELRPVAAVAVLASIILGVGAGVVLLIERSLTS